MLFEFLKSNVSENAAPFAAVALFVIVVGASLWLTPRLARWIDRRKQENPGFYDGMVERPPKDGEEK